MSEASRLRLRARQHETTVLGLVGAVDVITELSKSAPTFAVSGVVDLLVPVWPVLALGKLVCLHAWLTGRGWGRKWALRVYALGLVFDALAVNVMGLAFGAIIVASLLWRTGTPFEQGVME